MTDFTVKTNANEVALQFQEMGAAVKDALLEKTKDLEQKLLTRAEQLAATLRQVRTGKYEGSFRGSVTESNQAVMARVLSGDPIAGILEWGARIPPHDIEPSRAKALHFFARGDVFAMRAHFPGAEIKGKPVLHRALAELQGQILEGFSDVVNETVERMKKGLD